MTTSAQPSAMPSSERSLRDIPTPRLLQVLKSLPWRTLAREEQLPPATPWRTWLLLGGRGSGKTRTGAEWVQANIDRYARWHLVGPTASAVRDVMIEGESGILAISRNQRPKYEPSK